MLGTIKVLLQAEVRTLHMIPLNLPFAIFIYCDSFQKTI